MERKRSSGFRRIFTVTLLLFLARAGQSLILTQPKITYISKATVKIRQTRYFVFFPWSVFMRTWQQQPGLRMVVLFMENCIRGHH